MKPSTNPKSPLQRDADDFLRAIRRLLRATPTRSDPTFVNASTMRTLERCVRGLEAAQGDDELIAAMKLSMELLGELQLLGFRAAEDQILLDEPDTFGHMARATELMKLIEELEAIRMRDRE